MDEKLKILSREELLKGAQSLVSEERKLTLRLIEYLKEIENRLLYLELGFPNMWKFCVLFLGLSEGTTQRRLDAMRLSKKVPEVTNDLETGKLSFSVVSQLQSFFRSEDKLGNERTGSERKGIIESVHGMSQKECSKRLFEISPASALPKERELLVSADKTELRVILDEKVMEKLRRLKGLLGHRLGDADYGQLIELLADEVLDKLERKKGLKGEPKKKTKDVSNAIDQKVTEVKAMKAMKAMDPIAMASSSNDLESLSVVTAVEEGGKYRGNLGDSEEFQEEEQVPPPVAVESATFGKRMYVTVAVERAVWRRAEGFCEFVGLDGRRCMSEHYPELDHRTPVAQGGDSEFENMFLVCKAHNVFLATQKLSRRLMEKYVPSLRGE